MTKNKRRDILGPGLLKVKKNVSDKHEKQLKTAISGAIAAAGPQRDRVLLECERTAME
jgi:hypothetical protein